MRSSQQDYREGNYDSTSGKDLHISWAAYHSRRQQLEETPILGPAAVSALLPLFPNDSKSVAMIRHSMNVVKKAVAVLNPGQIPVITFDQPLFKIAKQIQWMWPEEYGEGVICSNVGWPTHQDDIAKGTWRFFGWQWLDVSTSAS